MKQRKKYLLTVAFIALVFNAFSQEGKMLLDTGLSFGSSISGKNPLLFEVNGGLGYSFAGLTIQAELASGNDGRYGPVAAENYLGGAWAIIKNGGLKYNAKPFSVTVGRFDHLDIVESPYSIFINGQNKIANQIDISFNDGFFFYTSRALLLNLRSGVGYPDRGNVFKTYGLKFGDFRIGYQDSATFVRPGSAFDADYFINPLPGFFIQYIDSNTNVPWSRSQNDNAIMGLFADYKTEKAYAYTQLLIDDICLNKYFKPESRIIPDKIAFSLGGRYKTPAGTFAAHLGLATKYTFESFGHSGIDNKYGYTYYPDVSFSSAGTIETISIEDNMIGFCYGENALALMFVYNNDFSFAKITSDAEYRVRGSQSPANPWHDGLEAPYDTEFLNDPILEHRIRFRAQAEKNFGNITLLGLLETGYVFNPSVLRAVTSDAGQTGVAPTQTGDNPSALINAIQIFQPTSGGEPILKFTLLAKYHFEYSPSVKTE